MKGSRMQRNISYVPLKHSSPTKCVPQPWKRHTHPLLELPLSLIRGVGVTEKPEGGRREPTNLLARLPDEFMLKS